MQRLVQEPTGIPLNMDNARPGFELVDHHTFARNRSRPLLVRLAAGRCWGTCGRGLLGDCASCPRGRSPRWCIGVSGEVEDRSGHELGVVEHWDVSDCRQRDEFGARNRRREARGGENAEH
jgi:hypothetical protein